MGALPKRRISTMRQGKRRAAIKLSLIRTVACANCGEPRQTHRVCPKCGFYNGREVIKPKTKKKKSTEEQPRK
ncbi:MAG: 50S ribosomal protein L32 [bacterium]|nr:50S ribosomal protein L32 [bacterium]